jgi:hypothetical protein
MIGLDPVSVVEAIEVVVCDRTAGKPVPVDYVIDNCSDRAVRYLSNHRRKGQWSCVRPSQKR